MTPFSLATSADYLTCQALLALTAVLARLVSAKRVYQELMITVFKIAEQEHLPGSEPIVISYTYGSCVSDCMVAA